MEKRRMIQIIRSVKGTLITHPDNEENSEFADRISSLEELEEALSMPGVSGELFCSCGKPSKMPLCLDCFKEHLDEIDPQNNYH